MLNRQRGSSLVEILLAVGISMMMLIWVGKMEARSMEDLRAKTTAEQMLSVRKVAEAYFKANKQALIAAMNTGTGAATWCSVNDTTKKICIVDIAKFIANGAAPAGMKQTTPYNQRIQVSYRLVNAATGLTEAIVLGTTNGSNHRAMSNEVAGLAAQMSGEGGGFVPAVNVGSCATTQACGVSGSWSVVLANFVAGAVSVVSGSVASYMVFI